MKRISLALAILLCSTAPALAVELALTWTASAVLPDGSNAPTSYKIYRRTVNMPFELFGETTANNVATTDATVVEGTQYCYRVSAANAAGESAPTNEACAIARDGASVAVQIPDGRTALISRRATDGSSLVSILTNKSDAVALNDSVAAPTATVVMGAPSDKTVLVSRRATDGSSIFSILVNKSQVLFINGVRQ